MPLFQMLPPLPQQILNMFIERFCLSRMEAMLQGILIAFLRARPLGAAMHAAPLLAGYSGGLAGCTCPCFDTATRTGAHGGRIALMGPAHFLDF